jgi:hypothetical protein
MEGRTGGSGFLVSLGMEARKARASATADPFGMPTRKGKGKGKAKAKAKAKATAKAAVG